MLLSCVALHPWVQNKPPNEILSSNPYRDLRIDLRLYKLKPMWCLHVPLVPMTILTQIFMTICMIRAFFKPVLHHACSRFC